MSYSRNPLLDSIAIQIFVEFGFEKELGVFCASVFELGCVHFLLIGFVHCEVDLPEGSRAQFFRQAKVFAHCHAYHRPLIYLPLFLSFKVTVCFRKLLYIKSMSLPLYPTILLTLLIAPLSTLSYPPHQKLSTVYFVPRTTEASKFGLEPVLTSTHIYGSLRVVGRGEYLEGRVKVTVRREGRKIVSMREVQGEGPIDFVAERGGEYSVEVEAITE